MMRTQIDQDNRDDVVWLQVALSRLLTFPRPVRVGWFDNLTRKSVMAYQRKHNMDPTGVADSMTLQQMQLELQRLGIEF